MDELPELLAETVGGETVVSTVDVGGGDVVVVTRTRTHLYRSDGLLSDESVETYGHDVDRFTVDPGRRKASLRLRSLDDEESFTVPSSVVDDVVAGVLEGILRTAGVVADDEVVESQFRFSELTLVITDRQLLRHVGSAVWDEEFEAYRYEDLGGLDFEEGSVATQVVLVMDGRQQRVKVPNDHAGRVREAVQSSIFAYHGVSSLGGLREAVAEDEDEGGEDANDDAAEVAGDDGATAGDGDADPGADVGSSGSEAAGGEPGADGDGFVSADWSPPADQDVTRDPADGGEGSDDGPESADAGAPAGMGPSGSEAGDGGASPPAGTAGAGADVDELAAQVETLADRVEYQTELLEAQQETIEQLVEELRRGR